MVLVRGASVVIDNEKKFWDSCDQRIPLLMVMTTHEAEIKFSQNTWEKNMSSEIQYRVTRQTHRKPFVSDTNPPMIGPRTGPKNGASAKRLVASALS